MFRGAITCIQRIGDTAVFFYSCGAEIFQFSPAGNDDDSTPPSALIVRLPPGRRISKFVASSDGNRIAIAARNEVYLFARSSSSSCLIFCGRVQDLIYDIQVQQPSNSAVIVVVLGSRGTVTQFRFGDDDDDQQRQQRAVTNCPTPARACGLASCGAFIDSSSSSSAFLLGSYFGDVFGSLHGRLAGSDAKIHEAGVVTCISSVLSRDVIIFATGSDERRASVVATVTTSTGSSTTILHLPFEPGRVRCVELQHISQQQHSNGATTTSELLHCATACEDGALRLYRVQVSIGGDDSADCGVSLSLASVRNTSVRPSAHDGGVNGGAVSLCFVSPTSVLSGGTDGRIVRSVFVDGDGSAPAAPKLPAQIRCIALDAEQGLVVVATVDWRLWCFDAATRQQLLQLRVKATASSSSSAVSLPPPTSLAVRCCRTETATHVLFAVVGDARGNVRYCRLDSSPLQGTPTPTTEEVEMQNVHSHPTAAAVSEILIERSNNDSSNSNTFVVASCTALGSVALTSLVCNGNNNSKTVFWSNGECVGRTLLHFHPHGNGHRLLACDRRGVHNLTEATTATNESSTTGSTASSLIRSVSKSEESWWCPALFSPSGDSVVHKNRFIHSVDDNNSNTNLPHPLCPDLPVRDVLAADERYLLLHAASGLLVLWDTRQGIELARTEPGEFNAARLRCASIVRSAAAAAGIALVAWSNDSTSLCIRQWQLRSECSNITITTQHECGTCGDVTCAAAAVGGRFIATGYDDGRIVVWSAAAHSDTGRVAMLHGHSASVLGICAVSREYGIDEFASVGAAGTIAVWRAAVSSNDNANNAVVFHLVHFQSQLMHSTTVQRSLEDELERFLCCASAGGRGLLAVGSSSGDVVLMHSLPQHQCSERIHVEDSPVFSIATAATTLQEAMVVAAGTGLGTIVLVVVDTTATTNTNNNKTQKSATLAFPDNRRGGAITALSFLSLSNGGEQLSNLIAAREDGAVCLWSHVGSASQSPHSLYFLPGIARTTPRAIIVSSSRCSPPLRVFVIEEGSRIVAIEFDQTSITKEIFSSASRIRGAALVVDEQMLLVAGQGMEWPNIT